MANLSEAELREANLNAAELREVDLRGAILDDAANHMDRLAHLPVIQI